MRLSFAFQAVESFHFDLVLGMCFVINLYKQIATFNFLPSLRGCSTGDYFFLIKKGDRSFFRWFNYYTFLGILLIFPFLNWIQRGLFGFLFVFSILLFFIHWFCAPSHARESNFCRKFSKVGYPFTLVETGTHWPIKICQKRDFY